ncbi:MAG: hydantoinase/oxoprolinase family protein [Actinomycetota bacterium]
MSAGEPRWPCSIAVDVGGTFTDLVLVDAGRTATVVKVPSVPSDPSEGVLAAIDRVAKQLDRPVVELLGHCQRFVHGSTVATNAVLEGRLAPVGLLTTAGFRDALEIRRGIRVDQWDHRTPWPAVVVPRFRRFGVGGRIDVDGKELEPLDEDGVAAAVDRLAADGVEAVALCFLHSYHNPVHEQRAAELARRRWPGPLTVASSDLVPLVGEYERTSTAVINAGLVPVVGPYLDRLASVLADRGLRAPLLLLQSNGGTVPVDAVAARPVNLALSGPAAVGGALPAVDREIPTAGGGPDDGTVHRRMVSMEIGGTSCDVAVAVDGAVPVLDRLELGGHHLTVASVDVHSVGAGGGTVASVDGAGLLRIGPRGAGSVPGPACYGRGGTEATATDAQLVLGRLAPGPAAGGAIDLDLDLATRAIADCVGRPLGLDASDAAIGIVTVLETHLRQAVETITIERGRDPGVMTLVAAGGAGGLHGSTVARALGCRELIVPARAGVFCATGMLDAELRRDRTRSLLGDLGELAGAGLAAAVDAEERAVRELVGREWPPGVEPTIARYVELRYPGQLWSVRIPLDGGDDASSLRRAFEREYQGLYGHIQPGGRLEVTGIGVVATGRLVEPPPVLPAPASLGHAEPSGHRRCWLDHRTGWVEVPIHRGDLLRPGHRLDGPYLIDDDTTTVLGLTGDRLTVTATGAYRIDLGAGDLA